MRKARTLVGAVLMVAAAAFALWENGLTGSGAQTDPSAGPTVESLFAAQRSDTWVIVDGRVDRILADDNDGSRHQRLIMRTASGQTVLIAHNIDLAPRVVALRLETPIRVYGEYEWSERGGVIHWTHHDPDGEIAGGWIEYGGERYR